MLSLPPSWSRQIGNSAGFLGYPWRRAVLAADEARKKVVTSALPLANGRVMDFRLVPPCAGGKFVRVLDSTSGLTFGLRGCAAVTRLMMSFVVAVVILWAPYSTSRLLLRPLVRLSAAGSSSSFLDGLLLLLLLRLYSSGPG